MNALKRFLKINKAIDQNLLEERKEGLRGFKAKMDQRRTIGDKFADLMTESFGTVNFFIFNAIFFAGWIIINLGWIPFIPAVDPYPFGLLTNIVSLEAIFLAIIVLISQNRAAKIADLREEVDLQINVYAEQEITKILNVLDSIHDHLGLPPEDDEELTRMKLPINLDQIEEELENEGKNQK